MQTVSRFGGGAALNGADCCRLGALLAFAYLELDALALVELPVALHLDLGLVHKEVLATVIGLDETESFGGVEPLDRPYCHRVCTFFALGFRPCCLPPATIGAAL